MSQPYLSPLWTGAQVDEGITRAYAAKERQDLRYEGTLDLANGVESGSVTGLGLAFVPTHIQLTISMPSYGIHIFACPVKGTYTTDGFDFQLSFPTDGINYRLHYTLVGDDQGESSS